MTVAYLEASPLNDVFGRVRAYLSALEVCERIDDRRAIVEVAIRLAEQIADGRMIANLPNGADMSRAVAQRDVFEAWTTHARACLAATCSKLSPHAYARVERASLRVAACPVRSERPRLSNVDARGKSLREVIIRDLIIDNATWITDLSNASLQTSELHASDFSYACFEGANWIRTRAQGCSFRQSSFARSAFINATFARCDLREARLDVATAFRVRFIGCDLRGAELSEALCRCASFVDCRIGEAVHERAYSSANTPDVDASRAAPWQGLDTRALELP